MKILVLGCNGMAGSMISQYFKEQGYDVYGLALEKSKTLDEEHSYIADATNFAQLDEIIKKEEFDYIINSIGILNSQTEINKALSITLNSLLPHHLANVTRTMKTKVIHMSTDCVFSGKDGSYTESAFPDAESFYGRTKALGELNDDKNLTIRTSIVGPDINIGGIGLFNWFMKQRGEINGYTKAIWTGVTTLELAKIMQKSIEDDQVGLVNMVNNKTITKFNLLKLFNKYFRNNDIIIDEYDEFVENKSLVRTNFDLNYEVPSYETMVKEMAEWVKNHRGLYVNYQGEKICGN